MVIQQGEILWAELDGPSWPNRWLQATSVDCAMRFLQSKSHFNCSLRSTEQSFEMG
jgi:hypothetical protein